MKLGRYLLLVGSVGALLVGATGSKLAAAASSPAPSANDHPTHMLEFEAMFGNMPPFIGAAGEVRGVNAAGLPWMIHSVHGTLDPNGQLNIDVDGLVLADEPPVPPSLQGTNPVPFFAGVVSCLTASRSGITTTNVTTANFPANAAGVAHIHQTLTLPHPCVAPIVFVTSPGPGAVWFAISGT